MLLPLKAQIALISAGTAAFVTLLVEYFAKPRLEARKDRIVEAARTRRTLAARLDSLHVEAAVQEICGKSDEFAQALKRESAELTEQMIYVHRSLHGWRRRAAGDSLMLLRLYLKRLELQVIEDHDYEPAGTESAVKRLVEQFCSELPHAIGALDVSVWRYCLHRSRAANTRQWRPAFARPSAQKDWGHCPSTPAVDRDLHGS